MPQERFFRVEVYNFTSREKESLLRAPRLAPGESRYCQPRSHRGRNSCDNPLRKVIKNHGLIDSRSKPRQPWPACIFAGGRQRQEQRQAQNKPDQTSSGIGHSSGTGIGRSSEGAEHLCAVGQGGSEVDAGWPGWERGVTGFKSRERDITQKEESQ